MEQEILNKMAEYDFSAPINVTIIFEDSDDDSQTIIDDSACKNSDTTGAELETVTTNHEPQYLQVARDKNNITKENKRAKRDIINHDVVNNNNNSQANSKSRKRKMKDPEDAYSVKAIVDKYEKLKHAHQQKNTEMHTNPTQHVIQTINSEEPPNMCQQKNQNEVANNVNNSLVKLSENLIIIMDYYYQMHAQLRSANDENMRAKYKSAFMCIQRHFLNASYDILNALILPQENNTTFINSFLHNTVKKAVREKGIKCNHEHVYSFYKNMVQWAKLEKRRINTTNAITCLKQCLNKPPMQLNIPAHGNAPNANQCTYNSGVFSCGPPGRQITIRRLNPGDTLVPQACNPLPKDNEHSNNFTPVHRTPVTNNNLESFEYNNPPVPANHHQARSNYLSQKIYRPPVPRQPPPTYSMRQQNYHQNTNSYLQTMTTQSPTQNQVDTTRSTESIESGYVSPSFGSPNIYQMNGVRTEEQMPCTPAISNIVSLSQRLPYTGPYGCHLCGRITELWCPGCCTNYCSTFCEQLDSQYHRAVCRECTGGWKNETRIKYLIQE